MSNYKPFTPKEVCQALALEDCEGLTGEEIARDMLKGKESFNIEELEMLAIYKGISAEELMELDPAFKNYIDPVTKTKKLIMTKMIAKGYDLETIAEICDVPVNKVISLTE